jgi:hypothetical protein
VRLADLVQADRAKIRFCANVFTVAGAKTSARRTGITSSRKADLVRPWPDFSGL